MNPTPPATSAMCNFTFKNRKVEPSKSLNASRKPPEGTGLEQGLLQACLCGGR